MVITDGNLEVKLPTIWTDEKTEVGRVREETQKSKKKKHQKNKMHAHEKVETSRNTLFCQCSGVLEGRKVGSLERCVRNQLAR